MYVGAQTVSLNQNNAFSTDGAASSLQYYGLPSNTSIKFSGNDIFTGQIYAPEAVFDLTGGGATDFNFSGLCLTKSVKWNGSFNFHFDESSPYQIKLFGYTGISWDEL